MSKFCSSLSLAACANAAASENVQNNDGLRLRQLQDAVPYCPNFDKQPECEAVDVGCWWDDDMQRCNYCQCDHQTVNEADGPFKDAPCDTPEHPTPTPTLNTRFTYCRKNGTCTDKSPIWSFLQVELDASRDCKKVKIDLAEGYCLGDSNCHGGSCDLTTLQCDPPETCSSFTEPECNEASGCIWNGDACIPGCNTYADCSDLTKPYCLSGQCVACLVDGDCTDSAKPVCDASGQCIAEGCADEQEICGGSLEHLDCCDPHMVCRKHSADSPQKRCYPCKDEEETCSNNEECCSGLCGTTGVCTHTCKTEGATCSNPEECCSGFCGTNVEGDTTLRCTTEMPSVLHV